ncbi:MAG: hypothetical protein LBP87_01640 [Planctomycetaceae bacterium]|nr:hypothetical protein [Planctomycetaceae bacterium]
MSRKDKKCKTVTVTNRSSLRIKLTTRNKKAPQGRDVHNRRCSEAQPTDT